MYGFSRTYVKAMGRLRFNVPLKIPVSFFKRNEKNVAIIGCGQFAFATIGFFLRKRLGNCIYGVYDIDFENAASFTQYYGGKVFDDVDKLISEEKVEYVFIASNHATHSDYAVRALRSNKVVYLEKPISVDHNQFENLMDHCIESKLFVGYNRPFSPAIRTIVSELHRNPRTPMTLNFFISGHKIPEGNWYRNPEEGTRICGNIGHWIDVTIHLLNQIGLPERLTVTLQISSDREIDDNLNLTFVSENEDLITIILTSRTEPFEGINETINLQHGDVIAKIDDFRRLVIWKSDQLIKKRYFRKDVGHENAISQPFDAKNRRDFNEIKISTLLMLAIKDALLDGKKEFVFTVGEKGMA
jgi:predicted dehydrogenase